MRGVLSERRSAMRKRKQWLAAVVALAVVAVAGMAARQAATAEQAKAEPGKAPAFTLEDVDGKRVSLADFAGKIVVLEWANPGCPIWLRVHKAGT
jgi:cytochrome oxidase Cu insertion factor (SCO1/SenC/PrrC family)